MANRFSTQLLIWYFTFSQCLSCFHSGQTYNEVQHCFLTVGLVYPEDLFVFLINVRILSIMFLLTTKCLSRVNVKLVLILCISFQNIIVSFLFSFLLLEMQIEGRTFDVWCTMCSKTSLTKVFWPFVVLLVINILILLHDLTFLWFYLEVVWSLAQ